MHILVEFNSKRNIKFSQIIINNFYKKAVVIELLKINKKARLSIAVLIQPKLKLLIRLYYGV